MRNEAATILNRMWKELKWHQAQTWSDAGLGQKSLAVDTPGVHRDGEAGSDAQTGAGVVSAGARDLSNGRSDATVVVKETSVWE